MKELVTDKGSYIVQNRYSVLSLVWSFGVIFLLTVKGIGYYRYRRRLKRFVIPADEKDLLEGYLRLKSPY
jgi:hypothetical protein